MNTYNENKNAARTRRNAFIITFMIQGLLMGGIVYSSLNDKKEAQAPVVTEADIEASAARAFSKIDPSKNIRP